MITPEQRQKIDQWKKSSGYSAGIPGNGSAFASLDAKIANYSPPISYPSLSEKFLSPYQQILPKIGENISEGAQDIQSGITKNQQQKGSGALDIAKGLAKPALRSAGDVVETIYSPISTAVGEVFEKTGLQEKVIQPLADFLVEKSGITDVPSVQEWALKHPNAAEDFARALNLGFAGMEKGTIAPARVVREINRLPQTMIDSVQTLKQGVKEKFASNLNEKKVLDLYNRSIRPTVTGKNNAVQIATSNKKTLSGLKTIAENKINLKLTDANGEIRTGEAPRSVDELTQAIGQTKTSIFKQYDDLAKQAGEQGVVVDVLKIGTELTPVIESKSLAIANPKAVEYAKNLQDRLTQAQKIDAQTAQDVIQHYNDSLKAFYKNPSYDTASNVSIDALIANKFREALDEGIVGVTGKQYQTLKNKYGALSSIEKEVAHRNIVWGRQNKIGLASNLANITSGAELVRGLITMNPADIAVSGTIKGLQKWIEYLKNPDVGVSRIFSELEKPSPSSKGNTIPTNQVKQVDGSSPNILPQGKTLSSIFKEPRGGLSIQDVSKQGDNLLAEAKILRGTKGLTADNIMKTYPNIKLTKDVPATDIYGNKKIIPDGEKLTPYELKGNKILLQDGETYLVSKNQFQNIKGNTVGGEAKPFAPELEGLEESVRGSKNLENEIDSLLGDEMGQGMTRKEAREFILQDAESEVATKYENYTLPGGKNYREVLIKAPENTDKIKSEMHDLGFNSPPTPENIAKYRKLDEELKKSQPFKSAHWDEPNVLSHLRLNERTYKGKKVTFMEELQSDWAREARSKNPKYIVEPADNLPGEQWWATKVGDENDMGNLFETKAEAEAFVAKANVIPDNPNLKNWQTLTVKRALKDAVDSNSEYFAWINGEKTSARYDLATHLENAKWSRQGKVKNVVLATKQRDNFLSFHIDENGKIINTFDDADTSWKGKKLDEVLGKGLADKIMEKESGTLSGEGLKFGGEWAENLYDKQVPSIVKDLTGAKIEVLDMGLPIDKTSPKTTTQQGIRLTPEIKAKIRGEAPDIKTSGKLYQ